MNILKRCTLISQYCDIVKLQRKHEKSKINNLDRRGSRSNISFWKYILKYFPLATAFCSQLKKEEGGEKPFARDS